MTTLATLVLAGLGMAVIALAGSTTLLLTERTLRRLLLPLVAFAAGALLGGAWFHLLPAGLDVMSGPGAVFAWTAVGFTIVLFLEQSLHLHHCRHPRTAYTTFWADSRSAVPLWWTCAWDGPRG